MREVSGGTVRAWKVLEFELLGHFKIAILVPKIAIKL